MKIQLINLLALALSCAGFLGWCWVWYQGKYKTGATLRTQVGVMLFGLGWAALIFADTYQHLQPTWGSLLTRALVIIALWCCMPLLLQRNKNGAQQSEKG